MPLTVIGAGDLVLSGALSRKPEHDALYDELRKADSCFVNLEMPLTKSIVPAEKMITIKADPSLAHQLKDLDIDVLTFANNHSMDYGVDGLRDTLRTLDQLNVGHVGAGENIEESFAPLVKTIQGQKVAYIGVTTTLPNGSGAGRTRPGVAGVRVYAKYVVDTNAAEESPGMAPYVETQTYAPDERVLLENIKKARLESDIVLVAMHWGVPRGWVASTQDEIATYQRPLAEAMIDAGASAIFGHHPHFVQEVDFYKGVPIFYSLGNFIFSNDIVTPDSSFRTYPPYQWGSLQDGMSNIGALAKVVWEDGALQSCTLIPISLDAMGEPSHASPEDAELLRSRLATLAGERGTKFEIQTEGKTCQILVTSAGQ